MKSKYTALVGAVAGLMIMVGLGSLLAGEFKSASIAEIKSAAADSKCVKNILQDANRWGQEIHRRDLKNVKDKCVSVDQQSKAFG